MTVKGASVVVVVVVVAIDEDMAMTADEEGSITETIEEGIESSKLESVEDDGCISDDV